MLQLYYISVEFCEGLLGNKVLTQPLSATQMFSVNPMVQQYGEISTENHCIKRTLLLGNSFDHVAWLTST